MPLSIFTSVATIGERSEATPGLFNRVFSIISQNLDQLNSNVSQFVLASSVGTAQVVGGFSSNTLRPESGSTVSLLPTAAFVSRSIDSGGQVFDVRAFGAAGDALADDTASINSAIAHAQNVTGGIVYIPRGTYRVTSTLSVAPAVNRNIQIIGEGRRISALVADAANMGVLFRFGSSIQDPQASTTSIILEGAIRKLQLGANSVASNVTLLQLVEPDHVILDNLLIQNASVPTGAGCGLWLSGSSITGGVDSLTAPEARRCKIYDTRIANCGRPLVLENADENDFYSCQFAATSSISTGLNTISCIDIISGRNNRFFGTLLTGSSSQKSNYVGARMRTPVNGQVRNNQFYGLVAENFNIGVWVQGTGAAPVIGTTVIGYHSSQNTSAFSVARSVDGTLYYEPIGGTFFSNQTLQLGNSIITASQGIALQVLGIAGQFVSTFSGVGGAAIQIKEGSANVEVGLVGNSAAAYMGATSNNSLILRSNNIERLRLNSGGTIEAANAMYYPSGTAVLPSRAYASEVSLGWYRSGVSTMALSYGSFNINQARTVSMRTLAASSLTPSAANTNTIADECGFTIGGASGASFWINSGGTTYIFNSAISAANA